MKNRKALFRAFILLQLVIFIPVIGYRALQWISISLKGFFLIKECMFQSRQKTRSKDWLSGNGTENLLWGSTTDKPQPFSVSLSPQNPPWDNRAFTLAEMMMDMTVNCIPLENRWFASIANCIYSITASIAVDERTQFSQECLQLWSTPSYFLLHNNWFL